MINKFFRILTVFIIINLLFSVFLYSWATNQDIGDLPSKPVDRFTSILFMNISTFTLTGASNKVKSKRIQILMSIYMLVVFAALISFT
jgi:hypothetical protein